MIDLPDFEQREVAFAVFRRTNQSRDRIAGTQGEAPDLARANVNVVRACQVRAIGRTQETESILQDFENAIAVDVFAVFRMCLENGENDLLLAVTRKIIKPQGLTQLNQIGRRPTLEIRQVHDIFALFELFGRNYLETSFVVRIFMLWWTTTSASIGVALAFAA